MTNKEAVEKLKEILFMTGYKEALDLAIKALEEKIWTLTSEMLPEEYDSYLVMWRCLAWKDLEGNFKGQLFYEICEYDPEADEWEKIEQAGKAGAEIVAWMPLPERYKPKEKEE